MRLRHTVEKRYRGLRYGLLVGRSADLQLPSRLWMGRSWKTVAFPDERGVRTALAEILLSDTYALDRRRGGRAILDLGANVGLFSLAARRLNPDAVIHAYEPNEELAGWLRPNMAAAGAEWFPVAVGARSGNASLRVEPGESVQTEVQLGDGPITVDAFCEVVERLGKVDFAKIDIEGGEWDLFDELALGSKLTSSRSSITSETAVASSRP